MAKKPETATRIADNKKAAFNYFFEERLEAGIVLEGWEVKSLREARSSSPMAMWWRAAVNSS
jgi:SsrA-binding protein